MYMNETQLICSIVSLVLLVSLLLMRYKCCYSVAFTAAFNSAHLSLVEGPGGIIHTLTSPLKSQGTRMLLAEFES